MKLFFDILILIGSLILAIVVGFSFCKFLMLKKEFSNKIKFRKAAAGVQDTNYSINFVSDGMAKKLLLYMVKVAYSLTFISSESKISLKLFKSDKLGKKLQELCLKANMPDIFGNYALKEVQIRLGFLCSLAGALIGSIFSYLLMLILFIAGIIIAIYLPIWALKQEIVSRTNNLEKSLPEMLEVVALGLRSGLTFDRSLAIYTKHFDNEFSSECSFAQKKWESGICLRDESLRSLALSYGSPLFSRVIENIIRSLRFGSSLVEGLEEAAVESRNLYKTKQEEIVAKAPVKMMIPTGTLILPAMLLMVLGPVLLELVNGF